MFLRFDSQIGVNNTGAVVAAPDHGVSFSFIFLMIRQQVEIIILTG